MSWSPTTRSWPSATPPASSACWTARSPGTTAPLTPEEAQKERAASVKKDEAARKAKRPSMSLWTSFGLSLKNLFTKKGRTALTSFAGSIGIIGIALIYAVSQGTTAYIDAVQEDTLSSYPP